MTSIPFHKYHGAGNDFVIIDQRKVSYLGIEDQKKIEWICDRRFGVGADGLLLLQNKIGYDFEMIYFNADGREGSMCGNGGRCIVAFAYALGIIQEETHFLAIDGPHDAKVVRSGWIELKMIPVDTIEQGPDFYFLNTGSPHYVQYVQGLDDLDIVEAGKAIRYSDRFKQEGTNVNFVEETANGLKIATYERGVEDETLACGTGITAAAITYYLHHLASPMEVNITAKGGDLSVRFQANGEQFDQIWLCGPAQKVFEGNLNVPNG